MRLRLHGALAILLSIEFVLGVCALGWRVTRSVPPAVNLSRLPAATAADLKKLQHQVWSDRPSAWLALGEAYLAYGYFPEAEACLKRATLLDPRSFAAAYGHAYSLDRLCRLPEADAQFRKAAALTDGAKAGNCWYHVGINHLRQEDEQQAEQAFVQSGDGYAPAVYWRARLLIRSGRSAEALPLIESLRGDLSLDVQTEMLAVQAFRELEKPLEMDRAAERAERSQERLRLNDTWEYLHSIRARFGLVAQYAQARGLLEQSQLRKAADGFRYIMNSDAPEYTEGILETAARAQLMAGRAEDARNLLAEFQQRMSLSPPARHLLGDALAATGHVKDAIESWESANRFLPDEQSYRSLADAQAHLGAKLEAKHNLELATLYRGIGAYRANELNAALKELDAARQVLKSDPRPEFYLGETYFALSQLEPAREAYQRCIAIDPNHGRALERLNHLGE